LIFYTLSQKALLNNRTKKIKGPWLTRVHLENSRVCSVLPVK